MTSVTLETELIQWGHPYTVIIPDLSYHLYVREKQYNDDSGNHGDTSIIMCRLLFNSQIILLSRWLPYPDPVRVIVVIKMATECTD